MREHWVVCASDDRVLLCAGLQHSLQPRRQVRASFSGSVFHWAPRTRGALAIVEAVSFPVQPRPLPAAADVTSQAAPYVPTFEELYETHFAFVWRTLRRLGVADAQLDDASQEVYVVVHR